MQTQTVEDISLAGGLSLPSTRTIDRALVMTILVAAFGYFVDMYDLVLFGIYRVPSLRELGLSDESVMRTGMQIMNIQMVGMIIGGVLWGVLGDKRGRKSVLMGSILLYSLANIANGFVHSIPAYTVLRFIAGVGLAGELGAALTLISEVMSRSKRGMGSTVVFSIGFLGGGADRNGPPCTCCSRH